MTRSFLPYLHPIYKPRIDHSLVPTLPRSTSIHGTIIFFGNWIPSHNRFIHKTAHSALSFRNTSTDDRGWIGKLQKTCIIKGYNSYIIRNLSTTFLQCLYNARCNSITCTKSILFLSLFDNDLLLQNRCFITYSSYPWYLDILCRMIRPVTARIRIITITHTCNGTSLIL